MADPDPASVPPVSSGATARAPLPATVITLGWVSLLQDIASDMSYPLLPLFLSETLKAPALVLGGIEGCAEALISLVQGWSGIQSDRIGQRVPFVRGGYGLAALGKLLLPWAHAWPVVLAARLVDRLGKGLRGSARDALIADVVPRGQLGQAYGLHRAMDTAGAVIGALFAMLVLIYRPGDYRDVFLVSLIPAVASALLTWRVREPPKGTATPKSTTQETAAAPKQPRTFRDLPAAYWRVFSLLLIFALANSSDTFLLLRGKDLGLSDAAVVGLYVVMNVVAAISAYPAGLKSDKVGRWWLLVIGWVLFAGVYGGMSIATSKSIWALLAVYGLYSGLTQGVSKALIADHAPSDAKGLAIGTYQMGLGFATLTSSLVTGWLWDRYTPATPFQVSAVLTVVALVLVPVLRPSKPPAPSRPQASGPENRRGATRREEQGGGPSGPSLAAESARA
ncbi:MAG: MFS transporter [bacterium]